MDIIVDITEHEWEYLNKLVLNGDVLGHYERLLVNGTPIRKVGKLIDTDRLKEIFRRNVVGGNAYFDLIDSAPTVEAIPRDQYENRLRADMVAMLEDLDLQIDESAAYDLEVAKVQRLIRDKIDNLKGEEDGNKRN